MSAAAAQGTSSGQGADDDDDSRRAKRAMDDKAERDSKRARTVAEKGILVELPGDDEDPPAGEEHQAAPPPALGSGALQASAPAPAPSAAAAPAGEEETNAQAPAEEEETQEQAPPPAGPPEWLGIYDVTLDELAYVAHPVGASSMARDVADQVRAAVGAVLQEADADTDKAWTVTCVTAGVSVGNPFNTGRVLILLISTVERPFPQLTADHLRSTEAAKATAPPTQPAGDVASTSTAPAPPPPATIAARPRTLTWVVREPPGVHRTQPSPQQNPRALHMAMMRMLF